MPFFRTRGEDTCTLMIFWIVITALALSVTAILLRASGKGQDASTPASVYDVQVYRDQLAEVDRDLARGIVNPEDAERTRTEISRRILAADSAQKMSQASATKTTGSMVWNVGIVAVLVLGSLALYWRLGVPGYGDLALADRIESAEIARANRPSQADAEAELAEQTQADPEPPAPEYAGLVDQLRRVVQDRPNDEKGLRLLAVSERNLGNFNEAHQVFGRYLDVRGTEATPQDFADMADMLILAAGGYVSPEAEAALALALQGDPTYQPARFFQGVMLAQTGRPDQAFQIWDRLLREGPAEAPWIPLIQAQIDEIAVRAGITYTQPAPGSATRGPSSEDIEAAGELSPTERLEMIEGMVSGLAERLSTEGGTVEDWARLITSLSVLGRTNDSFTVYQNAVQVFADDPSAMDVINRAGDQAGVAN